MYALLFNLARGLVIFFFFFTSQKSDIFFFDGQKSNPSPSSRSRAILITTQLTNTNMSKQKKEVMESDSNNDEVSEDQLDGSVVDADSAKKVTFASLGLDEVLCRTCEKMGWTHASAIQAASIPYALQGKDVIGLAQTGSGKTASFALPILHNLLQHPQQLYALVMAPTRLVQLNRDLPMIRFEWLL